MTTIPGATNPELLRQRLNGNGRHDEAPPARIFPNTDTGNAERLVHHHGADLRYVGTHKSWRVWTGTHWGRDETGRVDQFAKTTVRHIADEAVLLAGDEYVKHLKWAITSESSRARAAMIELARSEPGIPAMPGEFDTDPWLFNVANGTIDLRTGQMRALRAHRQSDMIAKLAPVAYDPAATCPRFTGWLHQIMLGRDDLVTFLQRAMGYSLTGKVSERVVFVLHGQGRNGKTTLLETMAGILGDYAGTAPAEMLLAKREGGIPNDVARLPGSRFVSATETGDGRRLDEPKVKSISGGDTISARFLHGEFFDFKPTFKIWLGTNHKPQIRGGDDAIWDRVRLIPFDYRVPDDARVLDLSATFLDDEAPGILAWLVQGCLDWQRDGLAAPATVLQATASYRREQDPLANWIEDRCELRAGVDEAAKTLYADYVAYCEQAGEEPLKQRTFGMKLTDRGCGERKSGGTRYRTGIRLIDPKRPDQATFAAGDTSHSAAPRDGTSRDTSLQKAHDSGGFGEVERHKGHTGHDGRRFSPMHSPTRDNPEPNVPNVPNVPNGVSAYPEGEAGNDRFTF